MTRLAYDPATQEDEILAPRVQPTRRHTDAEIADVLWKAQAIILAYAPHIKRGQGEPYRTEAFHAMNVGAQCGKIAHALTEALTDNADT